MGRLPLDTIQKTDYPNIEVKGNIKKFYGTYNYKVKLSNSNIDTSGDNRPLYSWFRYYSTPGEEQSNEERLDRCWKTKFVNAWTRHAYFEEKKHFDQFMEEFEDIVVEVQGPISQEHVDALEEVNNQRRTTVEQKVIRDRLYYQKFDAKLSFKNLSRQSFPHFNSRSFNNSYWAACVQHMEKLQNYVEDILGPENIHKSYNNVYLRKEDIKEVAMYMKLKYPDVIKNITEVIVIENLNNR